jgi:DNA-binding transcriptional LysR family regulator
MSPLRLDLHSLIAFYFVAKEESITSAADKLCLTQPTVTYHIRSLERNIGLKLLDIKRQKVCLTQAGVGLFQYVSEIYQQVIAAENFLEGLKESSLRIGMAATFSPIVASAAAVFEERFPNVKLIVKSASSLEVAEDVLGSQVDVGIVVSMDYRNPKLEATAVSEREKLVLVASPSSPISKNERVELSDLCAYPLVAGPETSATRQIVLKKFEDEGFKMPPLIVEVNSLEWGMSLVESGKGMGIYHTKAVEREISEGRLKVLPLVNDIWVGADALLLTDAPEHPAVGKFISVVKEAFKNRS